VITFGLKLGEGICRAVGVDPKTVVDLKLEVSVHEPARITFTRLIHDDEANELVTVVERYRLAEIEDEAQS
jgi:hypothetical protein